MSRPSRLISLRVTVRSTAFASVSTLAVGLGMPAAHAQTAGPAPAVYSGRM